MFPFSNNTHIFPKPRKKPLFKLYASFCIDVIGRQCPATSVTIGQSVYNCAGCHPASTGEREHAMHIRNVFSVWPGLPTLDVAKIRISALQAPHLLSISLLLIMAPSLSWSRLIILQPRTNPVLAKFAQARSLGAIDYRPRSHCETQRK